MMNYPEAPFFISMQTWIDMMAHLGGMSKEEAINVARKSYKQQYGCWPEDHKPESMYFSSWFKKET